MTITGVSKIKHMWGNFWMWIAFYTARSTFYGDFGIFSKIKEASKLLPGVRIPKKWSFASCEKVAICFESCDLLRQVAKSGQNAESDKEFRQKKDPTPRRKSASQAKIRNPEWRDGPALRFRCTIGNYSR